MDSRNLMAADRDEPIGAVSFGSDRTFAYDDDDVVLATRIADHVALAMAHERLAEESRRAARAQERANLLQKRVQTLGRGAREPRQPPRARRARAVEGGADPRREGGRNRE